MQQVPHPFHTSMCTFHSKSLFLQCINNSSLHENSVKYLELEGNYCSDLAKPSNWQNCQNSYYALIALTRLGFIIFLDQNDRNPSHYGYSELTKPSNYTFMRLLFRPSLVSTLTNHHAAFEPRAAALFMFRNENTKMNFLNK